VEDGKTTTAAAGAGLKRSLGIRGECFLAIHLDRDSEPCQTRYHPLTRSSGNRRKFIIMVYTWYIPDI
jgi:hypothetical protein